MKTIVTLLSTWVLLSILGLKISHRIFDSSELHALVAQGERIYGTVNVKDKENHRAIGYVYTVNDKEYSGTGHSGNGNPDFDEIEIGQEVIVVYDSQNPERSSLGYPQYMLEKNDGAATLTTAILSMFSFVCLAIIYIGLRIAKLR